MVMPSKVFRFAARVARYSKLYAGALQSTSEQIVDLFDAMNIHNNGGEVFLQRISDTLFARGMMSRDTDEQLLRIYDMYVSVDVEAELERLRSEEIHLKGREIREHIRAMRVSIISKYFE